MGNLIVGGIVFLAIGLAGYSIYKDKKNGKSCGCCDSCPGTSVCRSGGSSDRDLYSE